MVFKKCFLPVLGVKSPQTCLRKMFDNMLRFLCIENCFTTMFVLPRCLGVFANVVLVGGQERISSNVLRGVFS